MTQLSLESGILTQFTGLIGRRIDPQTEEELAKIQAIKDDRIKKEEEARLQRLKQEEEARLKFEEAKKERLRKFQQSGKVSSNIFIN